MFLVTDCVAECPTDSCGGELLTCKRNCTFGTFGDPECPKDKEEKMVTCPPRACGLFKNFN